MQVTAELSLYPLSEEYVQIVWDFIAELKQNPDLEVITNGMSTQIFGDIDLVMPLITEAMKKLYESQQAILVMKLGRGTLKLE